MVHFTGLLSTVGGYATYRLLRQILWRTATRRRSSIDINGAFFPHLTIYQVYYAPTLPASHPNMARLRVRPQ